MGIKGDPKAKQATSEQVRIARLTLEGNSAEDDSKNIERLIKRVIETTSCTQDAATFALYDNDNDLAAAVEQILEKEQMESWTENKTAKKDKKKDDDGSGRRGNRGRGGFGGRGKSNGAPRGAPREASSAGNTGQPREPRESREPREARPPRESRGGFDRPARGGRGGGGRGGHAKNSGSQENASYVATNVADAAPEPTMAETTKTVTEVQPSAVGSATTTVNVPTSTVPSFAAVAAAAQRKEELRKQQLQQGSAPPRRSVSPAPVPVPKETVEETPYEEPASSHKDSIDADQSFYQSEPSMLPTNDSLSNHADDSVATASSPSLQANNAWTKQLKSELGIGLSDSPVAPQVQPAAHQQPKPVQSFSDSVGVEFVDSVPTGLADYSFGFVDVPPAPVASVDSSVPSISSAPENVFNSVRASIPQKLVEQERGPLTNGDFNLKTSSPPQTYSNNRLSYADTSTVSYTPTDRGLPSKPLHQANQLPSQQPPTPSQQQQQQPSQQHQPQQQQQQQMMFPSQMSYYPYMGMYNTAPVRDDQYAALMQYGMGVDLTGLSTILPQSTPMSQTPQSQQLPSSGQHRNDSHGLMDLGKYNTQSTREQTQQQQPSNVAPPPGFTTNQPYIPQAAGLTSLFMQPPYGGGPPFGFMNMMPGMANANGRQMYQQEDDRKSYDKMSAKQPSQPNQQAYHHNNGNLGGMYGKKQYNCFN